MTRVKPGDRIVVTGATGFVGQSMVKYLANEGYRVVGVAESPEPSPASAPWLEEYVSTDLTQGWPQTDPFDGLIHLAGLTAVGPSFAHPQDYLTTNSSMVTNIFENALISKWKGRAIIVSSGAIYGSVLDSNFCFSEDALPSATSPYVVSKLLVENQSEYYRRQGIDVLVVRPFNHIGPGQGSGFILPDLARKIIDWQPGTLLTVGNLDSSRDYTDVRDIVKAYTILLELNTPSFFFYNVCSGRAYTGWQILEAVCSALGKPVPSTEVLADRSIDPAAIVGTANRLIQETGWSPAIAVEESIRDFVAALEV